MGVEEFPVRRMTFSVEQIVVVVKQAELGMAVSDLNRQMGISEQTLYRWKKQYAGHDPYVNLRDVLERLPLTPAHRLAGLLPHRWKSANTSRLH